MNRHILLIVSDDPRRSARVAEAFRIAAGLRAWKKVDVSIYIRGEAVRALAEDTSDFLDEEILVRYLSSLIETGAPIYLEQGVAAALDVRPGAGLRELSAGEFAELAAQCHATITL